MAEDKDKLMRIAKALAKKDPTYWGNQFALPFLMAWLSARESDYSVKCAYCGLPLLSPESNSLAHGTIDHLLPKKTYPQLAAAQSNAVPCCHRCNALKGRWDPNKEDPVYSNEDGGELNPHQREELKKRALNHVKEKLTSRHPSTWQSWVEACRILDRDENGTPDPQI